MSTIQPIAAAVSESQPLPGQDNRSGPNFQFVELPSSGDITVTITGANGVTCSLMQDVSGGRDPVVTSLTNGSSFAASKVKTSNNYYLASPSGASGQNFAATFMALV